MTIQEWVIHQGQQEMSIKPLNPCIAIHKGQGKGIVFIEHVHRDRSLGLFSQLHIELFGDDLSILYLVNAKLSYLHRPPFFHGHIHPDRACK